MKFIKVFVPLFFVMMVCSAFTMKEKSKGIYIVGVSASFSDSLVYFTDIQFLEGVQLQKKSSFLPNRSLYSEQLDDYLIGTEGFINPTSFIYFDKNKAKLEKAIKKMKENYKKGGKSILRETGSKFKFSKTEE